MPRHTRHKHPSRLRDMPKEKVETLRALQLSGLPRFKAVKESGAPGVKRVYFIRHGEATHNVKPKPWGEDLIDARLTEEGEQQSNRLLVKATALPIELVIVSPLTRAIETATRGLAPLLRREVPFVAIEDCREQFGGNLPDKRRAVSTVGKEYPQIKWVRTTDADTLFTPERETLEALTRRADRFVEMLLKRPETHIAVVTHSSFLAALLNAALDTTAVPQVSGWFANAEMREVRIAPLSRLKLGGGSLPLAARAAAIVALVAVGIALAAAAYWRMRAN